MATTTNYGWTTPDDTALVKDGASAIRTLGSSVDTTVKALNPGTTAGDLDYYTAATTKARIAKGTAGQVFTMNSGATAPEWATLNAGGFTLLSTTTLSGTSTTISGISGSYKNLQILIHAINFQNAGELRVAPNASTTITDETRIRYNSLDGTRNDYLWIQSGGYIAASDAANAYCLNIYNYASASVRKPFDTRGGMNSNVGNRETFFGAGLINTTSAITSLVFSNSQGGTVGGTVLIYGAN